MKYFLLLTSILFSAELRGVVQSAVPGMELKNVQIEWFEQSPQCEVKASSFVCINLKTGRWSLKVSADGFEPLYISDQLIFSQKNREVLWELTPLVELSVEKVKRSRFQKKKQDQINSVSYLSREEVNQSPGSSQDINRVLQTLPAVSGGGNDLWNEFYVRGGASNENGYVVDGMELNNLSHWGSQFQSGGTISFLHLDMVRDLEFYAANAPSALPLKLSSITDIRLREGNREEQIYQWDLNMAGTGAFLEGPLGAGSYMLNYRMSFLELLSAMIPLDGTPDYHNLQGKTSFPLTQNQSFDILVIGAQETIEFSTHEKASLISEGKQGGVHLRHQWNAGPFGLQNHLTGFYHLYEAGELLDQRIQSFSYQSEVERFQVKQNLEYFAAKNRLLQMGWSVKRERDTETFRQDGYFKVREGDGYRYVGEEEALTTEPVWAQNEYAFEETHEGIVGAGYLQWSEGLGNVKANGGLRTEYHELFKEWALAPQGGLAYQLHPRMEVNLGGGISVQSPGAWAFNDSLAVLDSVALVQAAQGVLGFEVHLDETSTFKMEGFLKDYWHLPGHRLTSEGLELLRSGAPMGVKRAYGFEVSITERERKDFFASLAFQSHRVEVLKPLRYFEVQDLPWAVNTVFGYVFNEEHELSARVDLSAGEKYTPVNERASIEAHQLVYELTDEWNPARRPWRKKVHLRYSSNHYFDSWTLRSYFEIKNVFNDLHVVEEYFSDGEVKEAKSSGFFPVGGVLIQF